MPRQVLATVLLLAVGMTAGCRTTTDRPAATTPFGTLTLPDWESVVQAVPVAPAMHRDWAPQHARPPHIDLHGSRVTVQDVRNFDYVTEQDYIERYETRKYDLRDLESVDFIVVPFAAAPMLAHTMLSFGFGRGEYLISSVEVRLEKGESYSPMMGALRQYEIIYVLADERDAIGLRAQVRGDDVYVYRVQATPPQVRDLFLDVADRVNQLYDTPEFYDTLTNNCTTNIARHVNRIAPNRVPYGTEILLPGLSGQLAYNLGLLDRSVPYSELARRSNVTPLARQFRDSPDFSRQIRR